MSNTKLESIVDFCIEHYEKQGNMPNADIISEKFGVKDSTARNYIARVKLRIEYKLYRHTDLRVKTIVTPTNVLRDNFAGQAFPVLLKHLLDNSLSDIKVEGCMKIAARDSYKAADLLLAEREEK